MEFSRPFFKQFRDEVNEALKPITDKYGIDLSLGSISFTSDSFSVSLKGKALDASGAPVVDTNNFNRFCTIFGLEPGDLGRKFVSRGETYEIIGISPNRPKYPIDVMRSDGKRFKYGRINRAFTQFVS
jgi:hypothetical protein